MPQIKEDQLKQLNQAKTNLDQIQLELGKIEIYKAGLLQGYAQENEKFENTKAEIHAELGKVSIDLKTGEYEIIPEDAETEK